MKRPRILGQRSHEERRQQQRDFDAQRREAKPWRDWYKLKIWFRIRYRQLTDQPLCERCLAAGKVVKATVVNHKTPHKGDWQLFISGPFESSCKPCHDGEIQREERAARRSTGG